MENYLDNTDERINSFSNSYQDSIKQNNTDKKRIDNSHLLELNENSKSPLEKKKQSSADSSNVKVVSHTTQIRISVGTEKIMKEALWMHYSQTEEKISARRFADEAIMSYVKNFSSKKAKE